MAHVNTLDINTNIYGLSMSTILSISECISNSQTHNRSCAKHDISLIITENSALNIQYMFDIQMNGSEYPNYYYENTTITDESYIMHLQS